MAKEINFFEQDLFKEQGETAQENVSKVLHSIQEKQIEQQKYNDARTLAKRVVEALLFASNEPVPIQKIREVTDTIYPFKPKVILEILQELDIEYRSQHRAFELEEIAQGYILRTRKEFGKYIDLVQRNKRGEKLSQAATEVLAIIAYRQPITRPNIDAIRGVDSSGIVQSLLERQLIEPVGKLEAPGRPTLYSITKDFLLHFGLKDLKDLPKMSLSAKAPPILHGPNRPF